MIELTPRVRVEPLLVELGRHPNVNAAAVREHKEWTWARHDTEGVRYGTGATLTLIVSTDPTHEYGVARLVLDGDAVAYFEIAHDEPYGIVKIAADVLR